MKLIKYEVKDFKSIQKSGEINCSDVTTLIGVNEAGKSNALLALWKLNPAREGDIDIINDMPVSKVAEYRSEPEKHWFIKAWFEIEDIEFLEKLTDVTGIDNSKLNEFSVKKNYNGDYYFDFFNAVDYEIGFINNIQNELEKFTDTINSIDSIEQNKQNLITNSKNIISSIKQSKPKLTISELVNNFIDEISEENIESTELDNFINKLSKQVQYLNLPLPSENTELTELVLEELPKFVYYSNYGNLDSEIYLPTVISDFKNKNTTSEKSLAKQRTLKVLFEYVNLNPEEIHTMGQFATRTRDYNGKLSQLTDEQIQKGQEQTKEREILLASASTRLTRDFKDWWKQGNYRFDFQADGDHFRIWVSDDKRLDKISLENRSTGLQWFLSFYLVFLVESKDTHKNSILLLDEAGTTLHPLAQKDLLEFFNSLSDENQIITTTHSPFLVDTDNLDKTKVVYVDDNGYTVISDDLRAPEKGSTATGAVYAVHAALGLSVSNGLLYGCQMVIVEGASDQYYLNAIKQYLISKNLISPSREILFLPSGGVKSVKQLASLVAGKQDELPIVLLDSDRAGNDFKIRLSKELYQGQTSRILSVSDFRNIENAEIEDLIPTEVLSWSIESLINNREFRFDDEYKHDIPLISQIETWSSNYNVNLVEGYKVELAKSIKSEILRYSAKNSFSTETTKIWTELFSKIIELN